MKIYLINGPAGSGKDTTAEMVANDTPYTIIDKFAAPIKRAITALYCNGDRETFDGYDTYARKGLPSSLFLGKSCRQVQIDISEKYMKPNHNEQVFGEILANSIKATCHNKAVQNILITDSGFRPEAEVLVNEFGADKVILIRLHKAERTFEGDSRSYIQLEDLGVLCYDVENVDNQQDETVKTFKEIIRGNS